MALPSPDEENTSADDSVIICKTPKNAAKKAITNLTDDILLLVSGRTDLAEKIRYEILAILGFG